MKDPTMIQHAVETSVGIKEGVMTGTGAFVLMLIKNAFTTAGRVSKVETRLDSTKDHLDKMEDRIFNRIQLSETNMEKLFDAKIGK